MRWRCSCACARSPRGPAVSVLALARPELLSLKPYSSARMEAGRAAVMLNANESPYAPFEQMRWALNRYPDPQPAALLRSAGVPTASAGQFSLAAAATRRSICWSAPSAAPAGRGADLAADLRHVCGGGRRAGCARGVGAAGSGRDFALDIDAILQAERSQSGQAGVRLRAEQPHRRQRAARPRCAIWPLALQDRALVVVDEAYVEFAGRDRRRRCWMHTRISPCCARCPRPTDWPARASGR
jgi:histidinol-phosphate aminotransferase